MLFSPSSALAAIQTLGTTSPILPGEGSCASLAIDYVQIASVANNYVVPSGGGTITSWSTYAGPTTSTAPTTGPVGLQIWRPVTGTTYLLVGSTAPVTLTPDSLNGPFTASIAVQANDVLGLRLEGSAFCAHIGGAGDKYGYFTRPTTVPPVDPTTETFTSVSGALLNVSVTLDTTPTTTPPPSSGCDSTGSSTGGDDCKQQ
jgi:hypothetical protein